MPRICITDGCKKKASFNIPTIKEPFFCKEHSDEKTMTNVISKKCLLCSKQPRFNLPDKKGGIYCGEHKTANMVNVTKRKCLVCKKPALFNVRGEKPSYCSEHKTDKMINVADKTCLKCDKHPCFNFPEKKTPIYCKQHREPQMVNVAGRKCLNCNIKPLFNYRGEKQGIYCATHRLPEMINVSDRCCKKCDKRPSYNLPNNKTPEYCFDHKSPLMIRVKGRNCELCKLRPSYNFPNEKSPIRCKNHMESGMIDVFHRKCKLCDTRASCNYLGLPPEYCGQHKSKLMQFVKRLRCKICKEKAEYGIDGELNHCEKHKEPNEINLVNLKCISCGLSGVFNSGMLCSFCNDWKNDSKRLHKQITVKQLLDRHGIVYAKYDKIIDQASCGKERPDFLIFTKGDDDKPRAIILEVDEHQHKDRTCECELTRMINIANAIQLQTMFIRYNPDNYKPLDDEKQHDSATRQLTLIELLKSKTVKNFKSKLAVIYLFYDGKPVQCSKLDNVLL